MEMAAQLVMNVGQKVGSASAPNGQVTSTADAGKQGGFSSALRKLLGGNASPDGAMNELTLSLAALLGGLMPAMNQIQDKQSTDKQADQVRDVLEANPELLAQLMNMPQMQQWLLKAQPLVTEEALGSNGAMSVEGASINKSEMTSNQTITIQQAKDIVTKLLQSVKQEPGSLLFNQLLQDLAAIIKPSSPASVSKDSNAAISGATAEDEVMLGQPVTTDKAGGAVKRTSSIHALNKGASLNQVQNGGTAQNRVVFTFKPESAASKLELLAAKASMNMPQVLFTAVNTSDDSLNLIPLDTGSTQNQNTLPLADPTLLQKMSDTPQKADAPVATDARRFVQDMSQFVIKNFKIIENGALSEAKLTLSPANLGHVDVKISMSEGQVVAHFVAQTMAGKEMLESQLPQLRHTLQNLGLQVERLDVSQNTSLSSGMFQDQRGGQSFQQSPKKQKNSLMESVLPEDFAAEMQTIAEMRNLAYGTQFNVTA